MASKRDTLHKEIGMRLRTIREEIKVTMEVVSNDNGMSRSYISDFERGYRLPTTKYLRYLHEKYNVNLNYVFDGKGRKFCASQDEAQPDFGKFQDEVDGMLRFLDKMPHALYAVLGFLTEYRIKNKELIKQYEEI